ncbi:DUF2834 domain-containing protein [Xanthomonas hyacinthi]|uniref:DUF2834 domain-containing protein n=1 Tax=Xanthomonas hyacinthi TaxID=56455 RepID=A0A2S7EUF3_9XANT|nr:DUF2834 domain-containing protein [Xanthomonas hyacinthi]KLD78146.1 hypothetical protein Y886_11710 [Xanthomonas hyacinthi DSM 19077]PPU96759.1 DUF2834 domain-containing protein [Xanthomonas hyacinthi]QGY76293.1 DUF2834 domain-containing protein [Xanthomonas hyacinthi]
MRSLYLGLCVVGTVVPLAAFWPWLQHYGLDLPLLLRQIVASPPSLFAWCDVLIAAMAVIALVLVEGRRLGMRRRWLPIVALLMVGVSLALPMFLWMRERQLLAGRNTDNGT